MVKKNTRGSLFSVEDIESGQIVSVFGVQPLEAFDATYGGEFLIWTSRGWDWISITEFKPLLDRIDTLEYEEVKGEEPDEEEV